MCQTILNCPSGDTSACPRCTDPICVYQCEMQDSCTQAAGELQTFNCPSNKNVKFMCLENSCSHIRINCELGSSLEIIGTSSFDSGYIKCPKNGNCTIDCNERCDNINIDGGSAKELHVYSRENNINPGIGSFNFANIKCPINGNCFVTCRNGGCESLHIDSFHSKDLKINILSDINTGNCCNKMVVKCPFQYNYFYGHRTTCHIVANNFVNTALNEWKIFNSEGGQAGLQIDCIGNLGSNCWSSIPPTVICGNKYNSSCFIDKNNINNKLGLFCDKSNMFGISSPVGNLDCSLYNLGPAPGFTFKPTLATNSPSEKPTPMFVHCQTGDIKYCPHCMGNNCLYDCTKEINACTIGRLNCQYNKDYVILCNEGKCNNINIDCYNARSLVIKTYSLNVDGNSLDNTNITCPNNGICNITCDGGCMRTNINALNSNEIVIKNEYTNQQSNGCCNGLNIICPKPRLNEKNCKIFNDANLQTLNNWKIYSINGQNQISLKCGPNNLPSECWDPANSPIVYCDENFGSSCFIQSEMTFSFMDGYTREMFCDVNKPRNGINNCALHNATLTPTVTPTNYPTYKPSIQPTKIFIYTFLPTQIQTTKLNYTMDDHASFIPILNVFSLILLIMTLL